MPRNGGWGKTRFKRKPECHSDREHFAGGKCKLCYSMAIYRRDREKRLVAMRAYHQAHRDSYGKVAEMYGVDKEQILKMLASQGNVCAVCGDPPKGRRLGVDHDHATGQVRAMLCSRCNTGLGLFRDDPALMEKAVRYLMSHKRAAVVSMVFNHANAG